MRLFTSLVPISQITCDVSGSFDSNKLHKAAQLILDLECIIKPLVVRQTGLESYHLVDGVFEYYTAIEAKKIDRMKGEFISAYIIPPGMEQNIEEQIALFRQDSSGPANNPTMVSTPSTGMLAQFAAMLQVFTQQFAAMQQASEQRIQEQVKEQIGQGFQAIAARFEALEATKTSPSSTTVPVDVAPKLEVQQPASIASKIEAITDDTAIASWKLQTEKPLEKQISQDDTKDDIKQEDLPLSSSVEPSVPSHTITETPRNEEAEFINFLNQATESDISKLKSGVKRALIPLIVKASVQAPFTSKEDCLLRMEGKGFAKGSYKQLFDAWKKQLSVPTAKAAQTIKPQEPSVPSVPVEAVIDQPMATEKLVSNAPRQKPIPTLPKETAPPPLPRSEPAKIVAPVINPVTAPATGGAIDKLNTMSKEELSVKLYRLKLNKPIIEAIVKNRPFTSFETMNIPDLGTKTLKKLKNAF